MVSGMLPGLGLVPVSEVSLVRLLLGGWMPTSKNLNFLQLPAHA